MRIALCQTIPLSEETRQAWKDNGAIIYRQDRGLGEVIDLAKENRWDVVVNYGSRSTRYDHALPHPLFLWNPPEAISRFNHPSDLREFAPDLVPPHPDEYPSDVWLKAPGQRGRGKVRLTAGGPLSNLPSTWDYQLHIDGEEYRAITVGPRMVQGFARRGDNNAREYEWTGLRNSPEPVKRAARTAARRLDAPTIIAWDCILDTGTNQAAPGNDERAGEQRHAFLLEGNTSPGVAQPTVARIVREMDRQITEHDTDDDAGNGELAL